MSARTKPVAGRIASLDWSTISASLDAYGCARTGPLLTVAECQALATRFGEGEETFRSHIHMARHGFGKGEYKYFAHPLPPLIGGLRTALYPHLATTANRWAEALKSTSRYPETHDAYLGDCHAAGQTRPTPLLLKYTAGDYNCLHQDLYGDFVFPLQVAFLLSEPGVDFDGGQLVVVEQRPRMQSRAEVVELKQGEAVIFAVSHRPVQGTKGAYRVTLRHGVSRLTRGERYTAGIIFHDAT